MTTTTAASADTPEKTRRTAGLVGNSLVLIAIIVNLCEFVGIIGTGVHTMPLMPGARAHELATTYAGQAGKTGFLVGWYALVLPFRVLIVIGVRQALLASTPERFGATWRSLLSWAVGLMVLGVMAELASVSVDAGTAAAAEHGSADVVAALNVVAHYLAVVIYCPSMLATLILGIAMWRSGVFPRVLAGWVIGSATILLVSGALLSAPSTADLQEGLTILNLLGFVFTLWLGVLVFVRRPRGSAAVAP